MNLRVENLHKSFGDKHVLKGLSFEAQAGQAFALLGRNGAGKTTTIRIIMDVFKADQGQLFWNDQPLSQAHIRVAYLPEERGLYEKEPILRQVIYIAELRGMPYQEAKSQALKWLDRFGMADHAKDKLETLSKGNQQKIQLAVALLNEPDLIIFDEPFSGLDPVNAQLLKDVILEQVDLGKVVFFSSHQMSYVENICQDMALLYEGKIRLQGSIREIRRQADRSKLALELCQDGRFLSPEEAQAVIQTAQAQGQIQAGIKALSLGKENLLVQLTGPDQAKQLFRDLAACPYRVDKFQVVEPTLEEIFIHYTGGQALDVAEGDTSGPQPDQPSPSAGRQSEA